MSNQTLTPRAAAIEAQFASPETGTLVESLKRDVSRQLADQGVAASHYDLYAIRRNDQAGSEIFGPQRLHAGAYDEAALYGRHLTPAFRFRAAAKRLAAKARQCLEMSADPLEFAHRSKLFWSEIGQLKDFLEINGEIDELVAALRTARFQFLRRDTPPELISALGEALSWIERAAGLDTPLVDRVLDRLESAGVDSFAQDVGSAADVRGIS